MSDQMVVNPTFPVNLVTLTVSAKMWIGYDIDIDIDIDASSS